MQRAIDQPGPSGPVGGDLCSGIQYVLRGDLGDIRFGDEMKRLGRQKVRRLSWL